MCSGLGYRYFLVGNLSWFGVKFSHKTIDSILINVEPSVEKRYLSDLLLAHYFMNEAILQEYKNKKPKKVIKRLFICSLQKISHSTLIKKLPHSRPNKDFNILREDMMSNISEQKDIPTSRFVYILDGIEREKICEERAANLIEKI